MVFLVLSLAAWACEPREPLLQRLEGAVQQGQWPEAEGAMQALVLELGCGALAEPALLARLWRAEAALSAHRGDDAGAQDALWAAARAQPDPSSPPPPDLPPGRLLVEPEGLAVALDGRLLPSLPAPVEAGLHLMQGGALPEQMQLAQVLFVAPGTDLVLSLPLQPPPPPPPPRRALAPHQRGLMVMGASMALGGLALTSVALQQNSVMHEADTHEAVDAAFRVQQAAGYTAYGLLGASVGSFVLASVWR
jgi:hypothetical protein